MRKFQNANEYNKANYYNIQFRINKDLLPEYNELVKEQGYKSVHSFAKALFDEAINQVKNQVE